MADANIVVRLVDQTTTGLGTVNNNLNKIDKNTKKVSTGFKTMATAAAGFVAAISGRAVLDFVSQIQNLDNRLRLVTEGQGELNERFDQLFTVANRTRAPLAETVELFTKLELAAKNVGLNTDEVIQVTENFNKVLAISGASGQEASAAILQFSQALASGTLRGDEFRSLTEAVPPLLDILAEKLGITRGELREYASKGLLDAELVSRALIDATQELNEAFDKTTVTVGQALTILSNNFRDLSRDFLESSGAGGILSSAILAIAESLDVLVPIVAVGAVGAFVALVAAISPVAAIIGGVTIALGAAVVAGRDFIRAFDFSAVLLSAEKAFLQFQIGALGAIEGFVNSSINALGNFKDNTVATFKGIGAAVLDPLNAFEAFDQAFAESKRGVEEADKTYVNFGSTIENAKNKLEKLENQTKQNTVATDDNTDKVEDNTDQTDENSETTDENTDAVGLNSDALDENEKRLQELLKKLRDGQKATEKITNAYGDFTKELERSAELARLDSDAREVQANVYRALEARAKDLKIAVSELSDEERAQVTKRVTELTELEQKNRDFLTRTQDFTEQTNQLIENNYKQTASAIKQIEREKQEFIQEARALGLENEKSTQDAILEYDRQIAEEIKKVNEEKYKDLLAKADQFRESELSSFDVYNRDRQQLQEALDAGIIASESDRIAILNQINRDYIEGTTKEYSNLYGFFEEKVMEFTGLTKKEFGILDDVTKLVFGTSMKDTIQGVFASGIQSILGFRQQGQSNIQGFGNSTTPIFAGVGNTIDSTFLTRGLDAIGSFAVNALSSLGGLGKGIFEIFGGVGDFLGNTFGGAFKSISGAIGRLFGGGGGGGGGLGGLFGTIGNFIAPGIGGIIGNIFGGFFAEGGYIPAGSFGIVGEAGAELVSGPATITSAEDTAAMLGNKTVNVNFSINAVDATGIDQLITDRRDLITTIVRNAVEEEGITI